MSKRRLEVRFKIFGPWYFNLLEFTVPVDIHAIQDCALTFSPRLESLAVRESRVRDWNSLHFWEDKDLASSSLYFLYSFLVLGFPADLGGGESPGAKTGWWQVWVPKQDVYEVRLLTVWILTCLRMCVLSPYSTTQALTLIHMNLTSGFHCHGQYLEMLTQLFS